MQDTQLTVSTLEPYEHPFQHLETELKNVDPVELPEWFDDVRVQTLRWRSGVELSPIAWERFVSELTREGYTYESDVVRAVRPHLQDLDCFKLCRRMLRAAENTDVTWTTYILGIIGSPHQVEVLGRDLESFESDDPEDTFAQDVVETLRRHGSTDAVRWLSHWAQKSKSTSLKKLCHQALTAIADRRTTTVSDIVEDALPSLGFDRDGHQEVSYGDRSIHLQILPDLTLQYRGDRGKIFKNIPRARRSDDSVKAGHGRNKIKEIRRELRDFLGDHAQRLEEAMCSGRSWPVRVWRKRFIEHPVISRNAPLFVFVCETETEKTFFSVSRDGNFPVNVQGERLLLPVGSLIRLAHAVEMDDTTRSAWIAFQAMRELPMTRPFKQLRRSSVQRPQGVESWDHLIAHLNPTAKDITRRARKRGMLHHSERNNPLHRLTKSYGAYDLTLTYQREASAFFDGEPTARVVELNVALQNPEGSAKQVPQEVPEQVYSEVARDICALAD